MKEIFTQLAERIGERPIGSEGNRAAVDLVSRRAQELGYEVETIPLACRTWRHASGFIELRGSRVPIYPGPFSGALEGNFPLRTAQSVEELEDQELEGSVLLLYGALAEEPLMPKEFPFYYPEEHRRIIELLEKKSPAAVIALTGKHPMSGQDPYPLFEDGGLTFPNGYASRSAVAPLVASPAPPEPGEPSLETRAALGALSGEESTRILIDSSFAEATSLQPIFSLPGPDPRIVVSAHIDTKYGTPGAIDNAGGVATMLGIMERLRGARLGCRVEFVPFNGEEQYGVAGQLAYLGSREPSAANTRLVVNLDGLGYPGSRNGVSLYNAGEELAALAEGAMHRAGHAVHGEEWIAGDHSIFAFAGIPCVAVTSSNMEKLFAITHTEADSPEMVDLGLLKAAAEFGSELIREVGSG